MSFPDSFMKINVFEIRYEVILFQKFFKYQNLQNKFSYVTNPEFRI